MTGRRFRALAVIASSLATLFALEGAVRVADLARGRSVRARTAWYWLYEQDPLLGYRGRPGVRIRTPEDTIIHNADGFRDARTLAEIMRIKDRKLVVCVGESSTYGLSAGRMEDTYPARLEARLRDLSGDQRWTVYNAGMPGYTSYETAGVLALRLLKARPSIVLAMNLRNDYEFAALYLDDRVDYDRLPLRVAQLSSTWPNELLMRSSLYGLVATRLRPWFADDLGGATPDTPHDLPTRRGMSFYRDNLERMAVLSASRGARLMCVDQPVNDGPRTFGDARREGLAMLRRELHTFCRERSVALLEANGKIPWAEITPSDDVHLGPKGYDLLATLLAPQILAAMAPPPPSSAP